MTLTISTTGIEDYLDGGKGTFKALIAGESGSGKTRMSSFAPKPIYAACEDGLMSVADRSVPYARIASEQDMDAFLRLLEQEAKRPEAQRRWETVVVDTIDAYERTVITNYLRKQGRTEMGGTKNGYEDWAYLAARMTNLLGRLMLLPMNVIVLVHTKTKEIDNQTRVVLKLKGEVGQALPEDFDFVGLIQQDFGLVEGEDGKNKRGRRRFIKWESTPVAPFLKCRGGALTETEVTFDASDFEQIFSGLRSQLKGLTEGEELLQIETEDVEAVAPAPGGAVSSGPKARPKATVQGSGAAPAPAKAQRPVPPRPPVVTPPPPAQTPDPLPPPTHDQAVETVKSVLGGEVIEETMDGMEVARPAPADPPQEEQLNLGGDAEPTPVTHVTEPAESESPAAESPAEPEPAAPVEIPTDGEVTVRCGQARYPDSAARAEGCGAEIVVTLESGRIVGTNTTDRADLMEVAGVKFRTFLDNGCFAKNRLASSANKG